MHYLGEMNNYKNRLRAEVERLLNELSQSASSSSINLRMEKRLRTCLCTISSGHHTSSWRSYKNTPWPPCNADTDESEARGWTDGWPHICNNNPAYTRLDEMNDYKNRIRVCHEPHKDFMYPNSRFFIPNMGPVFW